jgi:hypothetical protein
MSAFFRESSGTFEGLILLLFFVLTAVAARDLQGTDEA